MMRYWWRLLIAVQQPDIWPVAVRRQLLRWAGISVGPECLIEAGVTFVNAPIALGRGVYINRGCFLDGRGGLTLGDRVHLGPHVCLMTSTHELGDRACRAGTLTARAITIGEGSWIGGGACVLPGVRIEPGVTVAAGAVVRHDLDPDALYAGVPATRRKSLPIQLGERR